MYTVSSKPVIRIEVRTKPYTYGLEVLHEIVLREVRRPVERRVLDEVRKSELIVRLEHRSRVHDEPELGALLRLLVLADVVSNAAWQRADPDLRVDRKRRGRRGRRRRRLLLGA
jgi:hypothetical protein